MGVPQSVVDFYDERYWNFPFGEWGESYTIALAPGGGGYHIGLDVAAGDGEAIPALIGGTVHSVVLTGTMAWIVVIRGDDGRYYFYCHLANDNLPAVGQRVEQGDRVGRAANGPKGVSAGNSDFPGSAWNGRHVHLVVTDNPYAAYSYVPGYRTLDKFADPAVIIRSILADVAGGAAKPFTPAQSEEDDMYAIRQIGIPDSGIIIRPGVPPYPLAAQVFEAEASTYGLTIRELPDWRYATAVREQWTAYNVAEKYRAERELAQGDVQRVAEAVRAALLKP